MNDELLSIGKAAMLLGCHVDSMRRWEETGELIPERSKGNHRRYRLSQVEAVRAKSNATTSQRMIDAYTGRSSLELRVKALEEAVANLIRRHVDDMMARD